MSITEENHMVSFYAAFPSFKPSADDTITIRHASYGLNRSSGFLIYITHPTGNEHIESWHVYPSRSLARRAAQIRYPSLKIIFAAET